MLTNLYNAVVTTSCCTGQTIGQRDMWTAKHR